MDVQWHRSSLRHSLKMLPLLLGLLGCCLAQTQPDNTTAAASVKDRPQTGNEDELTTHSSGNWTGQLNVTANGTILIDQTSRSSNDGASTDELELLSKILDGFEKLLSKTYWEQRMRDPYFLGEILIPFTAGILVSWLLVLFVCTVKLCCCSVAGKRKPKKGRKIQTIKGDRKLKDGAQWMLLERNSSDEEI